MCGIHDLMFVLKLYDLCWICIQGPTHLDEDVDLHLVDSILSKAQETRLRSLSKVRQVFNRI